MTENIKDRWATVISGWISQLERKRMHHTASSDRYKAKDAKYAIATIVLGALTGTSAAGIFASMSDGPLSLAAGILGIATAMATGLRQYFDYGKKSQNHRVATTRCNNLMHSLQLALHFPPNTEEDAKKQLYNFVKIFSEVTPEDATQDVSEWFPGRDSLERGFRSAEDKLIRSLGEDATVG